MTDGERRAADIGRDARDLHRGLRLNLVGYALRLLYPLLTAVVVVLYGRRAFGLFTAAQAVLLLALRVCLLGLDKAVLWWVPRRAPGDERNGLYGVLLRVAAASGLIAAAVAIAGAPWMASWAGQPEAAAALRWMAVGLVPLAAMEVLVQACLGRRRIEAQIFIKEGLGSTALPAGALLFWLAGARESGLAWAFVAANTAALAGAALYFRRTFRDVPLPAERWAVPGELWRYALPAGLMETLNSALLRMDVLVVAALTDADTVGVYGVVVQVGSAIRSVRTAFDPLVLAIVSQIGTRPDPERLRAAFSRATSLVLATQAPIFAFLIAFSPWLLPLLGDGYGAATAPVVVLCAFWVGNGVVGLNSLVVLGYGHSGLAAFDVGATILAEGLLLLALVPPFGLVGAAVAVGLAFSLQNVLWAWQARRLAAAPLYDRAVLRVALAVAASFAAALVAGAAVWPAGAAPARLAGFAAFLLAGSGALLALRSRRARRAPGGSTAPAPG
ncbi:MAG: oligosaccharide flippase family protein [Deltaproteobacteria bacterium]|nr:oligosaccharide flippase family protein [Deltaproteobacteria bacterium]